MQFEGLTDAILANAPALNRAFIGLAVSTTRPAGVPPRLTDRLAALSVAERERVARAPFLLFSLDLYDVARWQQMARTGARPDLFRQPMPDPEWRLAVATLGVAWALAQYNRYAARFLTGASAAWCDYAAGRPLPELIETAGAFETLVVPRFAAQPGFWRKLLCSSRDARSFVRRAARYSALQCVLTAPEEGDYVPARSAACKRHDTPRHVAERVRKPAGSG